MMIKHDGIHLPTEESVPDRGEDPEPVRVEEEEDFVLEKNQVSRHTSDLSLSLSSSPPRSILKAKTLK